MLTILAIAFVVVVYWFSWLLFDVQHHSRAFITVLNTVELLQYKRDCICAFVSISIHKTLLNKVKAFTSLSLVLLSYMLWSVSKTGFFEEIEFGALIKARIAVVFV